MTKLEKGNWPPHNVKALEQNIALVFKTGDIRKLNKPTYTFIIDDMGFIAHYDLSGFQSAYQDLNEFARALQTSEYSEDVNYNELWATKYENDRDFNAWYGPAYCKSVSEGIRRILKVAKGAQTQARLSPLARGGREAELKAIGARIYKEFKILPIMFDEWRALETETERQWMMEGWLTARDEDFKQQRGTSKSGKPSPWK